MAGQGHRFVQAGYRDIKPLIPVDGAPIISRVVGMFPGERDFTFICAANHLQSTPLQSVLEGLVPGCRVFAVEPHRLGPVHSVLAAEDLIRDDEPVIVNYCDFSVFWDYPRFREKMERQEWDGCVTAYRGFHPHSLGNTLYAYIREEGGRLLEIQEKRAFTANRMEEYASAGTYYFRSGALMKHYFKKAIEERLETNGEYYASMPFNLMVEDGLGVCVHELEHFLQWGTPQDLEEYQGWSRYFARRANWKPSLAPGPGVNLVPMAGEGVRFRQEGYTLPKPLVPVAGIPMIERSLDSYPPAGRWIAVCRREHLQDGRLEEALGAGGRNTHVITLDRLTEGQASTCLLAREHFDPEDPLLIAPCDTAVVFDEGEWLEATGNPRTDCIVMTFRNHPHANRNPRHYGWIRAGIDGVVTGVSCKIPLGGDVKNDPGIIGAFWFRRGEIFVKAAQALVEGNRRVNNEFYVDSTIEVLLEMGHQVRIFDVEHYICFGTPDDVRTYEYWDAYFRKASPHPCCKEA